MKTKFYRKIRQSKDCIKGMIMHEQFAGYDEDECPIYDTNKELPMVTFDGTVKLHGTNAGIRCHVIDNIITFTPLSRSQVKGGAGGHMGFVEWVMRNRVRLRKLYIDLNVKFSLKDFTIFGEWTGKGIQSKVGVSELDKFFYVFDVWDNDTEIYHPFLTTKSRCATALAKAFWIPGIRMFSAPLFTKYVVKVDLNDPQVTFEPMNDLTMDVEKRCPVAIAIAKLDGVELKSTIGEGIVWKCNDVSFKTKGENHSGRGSRIKADIDPIMVAAIDDFVARVVTEERVQGVFDKIKDEKGDEMMMSDLGQLMPALFEDVMDEEGDALINGQPIEKKMIGGAISNVGRPMFQALINKF